MQLASKVVGSWTLPVETIRTYFGSQTALLFGLLAHFQKWLAFPAVLGTLQWLLSFTYVSGPL